MRPDTQCQLLTGLSDEDWVVLGAPAQHTHHTPALVVPEENLWTKDRWHVSYECAKDGSPRDIHTLTLVVPEENRQTHAP